MLISILREEKRGRRGEERGRKGKRREEKRMEGKGRKENTQVTGDRGQMVKINLLLALGGARLLLQVHIHRHIQPLLLIDILLLVIYIYSL